MCLAELTGSNLQGGMDQEGEEQSEEKEENVFEKQERVIPILFTGTRSNINVKMN